MRDIDNEGFNCQINLWNQLEWELDPGMLTKVMTVCTRHMTQAKLIDIYPSEREAMELSETKKYFSDGPGWLEWVVNVRYRGGGGLSIHVIKRTVDAPFECHT